MRRRASDDSEGGLDSLLDTMTNIVGILVIVLVVTQLGVGDAVRRITDAVQIDAQQLAQAQKELDAAREERDNLLAAMADEPLANQMEDVERRLQELQQQIEEQEKILADLQQQRQIREDELKAQMQIVADTQEQRQAVEQLREQLAELDQQWQENDQRLEQLQAMLAKTPKQTPPPAREITLPDPRPAPEGVERLTMICANNKVYLLPPGPVLEQIRLRAQEQAFVVAKRQYRTFNPLAGEGVERFLEEFNHRPIQDSNRHFDIHMINSGGTPRLRFVPREVAGEDERIVSAPRSRFQNVLRAIDPNRYYIRFEVCADSFDIYVTTRRIVSDMNLLAGWEPRSEDWTYTTNLGGEFRLGPKPPPKPPSPPKPGPVEPPKPPKPPRVID
jgi:hypothetical protein